MAVLHRDLIVVLDCAQHCRVICYILLRLVSHSLGNVGVNEVKCLPFSGSFSHAVDCLGVIFVRPYFLNRS